MALNMFTLFFVLASSCVTFAALIEKCPPEGPAKCDCSDVNGGIEFYCYLIDSPKTLEDIVEELKGYSIHSLAFGYVNVSMVPTDLFQGLHVRTLQLYLFEVDDASFSPGSYAFFGLEDTLETIWITDSFLRSGSALNLKLDNLHSLKEVIISSTLIHEIGNDWFSSGPKNLDRFIARGTRIEKLGDKAFSSLTNLRHLGLGNNRLTEISRSMLPLPATHLESLYFEFNRIRTVPSDLFSGMPALDTVFLMGNLINSLPENIWSPLRPQLRYLELSNNLLQCDQDLMWICKEYYPVIANCISPVDKKGLHVNDFCKFLKFPKESNV